MNTILIFDDTAFTRLVLRNMFEKLGNITMPGMNGLVASRKIIELDKNAKIIICSAVARRDTVIKAIQAGARDFIAKPLQFERIEWAVQHLLETDSR
ncbi:response regulator [Brevibacillus brevis]|uniref:response regulator n=1 Tax=Brevibacillus brevis TaxID=1393 RepID=UPI0025A6746B|nr:response regulator [Brevibacillus brevis]WJQ82205.1 response regulator [Brevibacillus brevis]